MIQEKEIIVLLIGLGVFIFVLRNRQRLRRVSSLEIFTWGFYLTLAGWVVTILEGFIWEDAFNLIEHICYAGGSVCFAFWCFEVFGTRKENG